jgi:hypothetical protein
MYAVMSLLVLIGHDNDKSRVMIRGIGVNGEEIMAMWCIVVVSVLCTMTDPAYQSYGQPYNAVHQTHHYHALSTPIDLLPQTCTIATTPEPLPHDVML